MLLGSSWERKGLEAGVIHTVGLLSAPGFASALCFLAPDMCSSTVLLFQPGFAPKMHVTLDVLCSRLIHLTDGIKDCLTSFSVGQKYPWSLKETCRATRFSRSW